MDKKELIAKINELLSTKLKLSKLNMSDLKELYGAVSKRVGGSILGSLGQGVLNKPLAEVLKSRAGKRPLGEMTINDVIGAVGESVGDKGPLGLGLLPRLFGKPEKGG